MTSITSLRVRPLADDLPFGATVEGVDLAALNDETIRAQLVQVFEDRGVVVFRNMPQDSELHLLLSEVFGPLQHHPLYVDESKKPTVIDLDQKQDLIRANGKLLAAFLPWHFDACYTAKLNRAAILRPVAIPPEGGWTGFADGIQLYNAISPELRSKFEDAKILYHAKLMFMHQKFGFPADHEWVTISDSAAGSIERSEGARRSLHPAIWKRASGESVLHVSPWQASGIYGNEGPEGDALLAQLCDEIYAKMTPYWHRWEMSDMVLWDNIRFIHAVNGNDPKYARHMQRATIAGDYGFGCFEPGAEGSEPPMMG